MECCTSTPHTISNIQGSRGITVQNQTRDDFFYTPFVHLGSWRLLRTLCICIIHWLWLTRLSPTYSLSCTHPLHLGLDSNLDPAEPCDIIRFNQTQPQFSNSHRNSGIESIPTPSPPFDDLADVKRKKDWKEKYIYNTNTLAYKILAYFLSIRTGSVLATLRKRKQKSHFLLRRENQRSSG